LELTSISKNELYFKDPLSFIPERWNKSAEDKIHPFSNLPFGFGPRSCYGETNSQLVHILVCVSHEVCPM